MLKVSRSGSEWRNRLSHNQSQQAAKKRLYSLPRTDCDYCVWMIMTTTQLCSWQMRQCRCAVHWSTRLTAPVTRMLRAGCHVAWHFYVLEIFGIYCHVHVPAQVNQEPSSGSKWSSWPFVWPQVTQQITTTLFCWLGSPDKVKRVLQPADDMKFMLDSNPDSCDIFQPHRVLDVYPDRPDEL